MADEADEIIEDEATETTAEKSPLDEFQELLDGKPQEAAAETEPESGEEESAEAVPAEAEPVVEETPESAVGEGPSFLMKQVAAQAGVPPQLIEWSRDDVQLQQLIEVVSSGEQVDEAAAAEPEPIAKVTLPEDEYGPDDPVRKQMQALVDALNAERAERIKGESELKEAKQRQEAREINEVRDALYSPFDEVLDSYESPLLGNYKQGLSEKQAAARRAVSLKYRGLGAEPSTPVEVKRRYAELALDAYDHRVVEQRNKKLQAANGQVRRVTGGGNSRPVKGAPSMDEILDDWNAALEGKKPLPIV